MVVQKGIGFRLLAQVGTKSFARLGRLVPVVGGAIGGGLDAYMLSRFAKNAKDQFPRVAPAVAGAPVRPAIDRLERGVRHARCGNGNRTPYVNR